MPSHSTITYNMVELWDDFYAHGGTSPELISQAWLERSEKLRAWWVDLMAASKLEQVLKSRRMLFCPSRIRIGLRALLFRFGVLQYRTPHLSPEEVTVLVLSGSIVGRIRPRTKALKIQKAAWKRRRKGLLRKSIHTLSGGVLFGVGRFRT